MTAHNKDGSCLMKKGLVSVYDLNDPVTPAVFEEANEPVKVQIN